MAGLVYIDDIDEIFSIIKEGNHLDLFREKDNRYDEVNIEDFVINKKKK